MDQRLSMSLDDLIKSKKKAAPRPVAKAAGSKAGGGAATKGGASDGKPAGRGRRGAKGKQPAAAKPAAGGAAKAAGRKRGGRAAGTGLGVKVAALKNAPVGHPAVDGRRSCAGLSALAEHAQHAETQDSLTAAPSPCRSGLQRPLRTPSLPPQPWSQGASDSSAWHATCSPCLQQGNFVCKCFTGHLESQDEARRLSPPQGQHQGRRPGVREAEGRWQGISEAEGRRQGPRAGRRPSCAGWREAGRRLACHHRQQGEGLNPGRHARHLPFSSCSLHLLLYLYDCADVQLKFCLQLHGRGQSGRVSTDVLVVAVRWLRGMPACVVNLAWL